MTHVSECEIMRMKNKDVPCIVRQCDKIAKVDDEIMVHHDTQEECVAETDDPASLI